MNKSTAVTLLAAASLFFVSCASSARQSKRSGHAKTSVVAPVLAKKSAPRVELPPPAAPAAIERIHTPLFGSETRSLVVSKATWALATPQAEGERLGLIGGSTRIAEMSHVVNDQCPTPWIEVEPQGWICVPVSPSTRPPTSARAQRAMRTMPGTYAIASKSTVFYKSMAMAKEDRRGRAAKGDMVKRRETISMEDGRVFWKTDRGEYVDSSTLRRLSGSRFKGIDLTDDHAPMLPFAFAVHTKNPKLPVRVRDTPSPKGRVITRLSGRSVVEVLGHSVDGAFVQIGEGRWLARSDLRIVEQRERPAQVEEEGRWIDVDLDQQLVVAYEGSLAVFATLASTGKGANATPTGVFNITRKKRQTTMRSDRSKRQTYSVAVPWPVYFNKGFAFHSTYWHNSFGTPKSHGCVNLSPTDAARLYRFVGPEMPAGWTVVYGHDSQPGTFVQVRSAEADSEVPAPQRLAAH